MTSTLPGGLDQFRDPDRLLAAQVRRPSGPGGGWLIRLRGELDTATAPLAAALIENSVRHGCRELTVDLTGVSYIGVAGLELLSEASLAARRHGRILMICGLSGTGRRVAEVLGLRGNLVLTRRPAVAMPPWASADLN